MNHSETILLSIVAKNHHCSLCNYYTKKSSDLKKHLETRKHKKRASEILELEMKQKVSVKFQCMCGLQFNSKTTLWRHKKNCNGTIENKDNNISNMDTNVESVLSDKEIIMALIKDINDFKNIIKSILKIDTKVT